MPASATGAIVYLHFRTWRLCSVTILEFHYSLKVNKLFRQIKNLIGSEIAVILFFTLIRFTEMYQTI